MPHRPNKICKPVAQPQKAPAQGPEVEGAADQHPGQQVAPHLPPARHGGIHKEGHRHHQPEQQVQQSADKGDGQAHPQDAQQVVHQPRRRPQSRRPQQIDGLLRYPDLHLSGTAG